ncbi:protein of unknown function DUF736 (plasmid) [Beijerinckia indica subsp. indica ATCC 9039]|uniref:DUF736 domain-containing protein n=2 Tax=Beijerinckia TaxID=532 RepID=B2IL67_BEII9|nr:DUF736 domain-containing protein [Beijerinckia indica]ACB97267.1 protein of unknown function DUF736 [Beijerinckia indica subsp. indica ATCC 9039]
MATIGSFTRTQDNTLVGRINTLTIQTRATLVPIPMRTNDNAPHYRIVTPKGVELGAAWMKTSDMGNEYLSVQLDDPSFTSTIYASLVEVEGERELQLLWSRPRRD